MVATTETEVEKVILDPSCVFGAETTSWFGDIARLLRVGEGRVGNHNEWPFWFEVAGGTDVDCLPKECPKTGAVILIFTSKGRIDRYVVIKPGWVVCKYCANHEEEYEYELSGPGRRIGQYNIWQTRRRGICGSYLGTISRIVIIPPQ